MRRRTAIATFNPLEKGNRHDPEVPRRLSVPALRSFFNLASRWNLDINQQRDLLGRPSLSTFNKYKAGEVGTLPFDTLTRISLLLGIYKALHILYRQAQLANEWIKLPNDYLLFGGKSPLDLMINDGIDGFFQVRGLLDARRSG